MSGDVIDPGSEIVLVDNISATRRQPQRRRSRDRRRRLPVHLGRRCRRPTRGPTPVPTTPPRTSACSTARSCGSCPRPVSLPPATRSAGRARASCRVRGTCRRRRSTACQELYAWGLRNPFRFAFDPNTGPQRFFINDVGQSTREEVDEGGIGRNYGWPIREGVCPTGSEPAMRGGRPWASPIRSPTTGARSARSSPLPPSSPTATGRPNTTAATCSPTPAAATCGCVEPNGAIDYATPFATDVGGIADMAFVTTSDSIALYYTLTGGGVRKITRPPTTFAAPGPLAFVAVPPGTRVLDTRLPTSPATSVVTGQHDALRADGRRPGGHQGGAGQLRLRHARHRRVPHRLAGTHRPTGRVEHQRRPGRVRRQLGRRARRRQRRDPRLLVLHRRRRDRRARLLQRAPGAVSRGSLRRRRPQPDQRHARGVVGDQPVHAWCRHRAAVRAGAGRRSGRPAGGRR